MNGSGFNIPLQEIATSLGLIIMGITLGIGIIIGRAKPRWIEPSNHKRVAGSNPRRLK